MTDSVDVFFVDRDGNGFGGVVLVESCGWWGSRVIIVGRAG